MSEITVGGPVWLASDIHLGPHNPKTSQDFYKFLALARHRASALILLGDIFEVWIGDDWSQTSATWLNTALDELRLTAQAIPLWLMGGNRDFLIGQTLVQLLDAQLIPDQAILQIGAATALESSGGAQNRTRFLLAHGDEFCTADISYQRMRRVLRHPWFQRALLALPLKRREKIAQKMRNSSKSMERHAQDSTYDVQDAALLKRLNALQLSTCIHGHTHRPGHYRIDSPSPEKPGQVTGAHRWVLPDWQCDDLLSHQPARGGWMQIDDQGPSLFSLSDLNQKMK